MTNSPYPRKQVSSDELNRLFAEGNWEQRLSAYRRVEFYNRPTPPDSGQVWGTTTIGQKYYDHDGSVVAIVFYYRKPDGTLGASRKPSPKLLLIDGVTHYV